MSKITHEQARQHLEDKIKDGNILTVLEYITQQEKLELEYKIDYNQNQEHISFMTKQYNDMREKYNNSNTEKLVLEHKQEKQQKLLKLYKEYYELDRMYVKNNFFLELENLNRRSEIVEQIKELENEKN